MIHSLRFRRFCNEQIQFLTHPIGAGRLTISPLLSRHSSQMLEPCKNNAHASSRNVHTGENVLRRTSECWRRLGRALPHSYITRVWHEKCRITTPETPKVWCDRPTLLPINNPITTSSQRSFNAFHPHRNVSYTPKYSRYAEMSWTVETKRDPSFEK